MPRSNLSSSQKYSADKKVKVAGPSNQQCYSSYTTQPYKWIWTKNKNNVLDAPASTFIHLRPPASTYAHLHLPMSTCIHLCQPASSCVHLCPPQCVTVPSKTIPILFSGTKFYRYRLQDFFLVPSFSNVGSETFSGTNVFGYRF